jgi:hypothetical protein
MWKLGSLSLVELAASRDIVPTRRETVASLYYGRLLQYYTLYVPYRQEKARQRSESRPTIDKAEWRDILDGQTNPESRTRHINFKLSSIDFFCFLFLFSRLHLL